MGNTASGESETEDVNQNTFIPPIENEVQYEDTIGSIQKKINKVSSESLSSTRRMVSMCNETNDVGIQTLVQLDSKGEQLNHIDSEMDEIARDIREAEEALTEMEKCCGLCILPCKRMRNYTAGDSVWDTDTQDRVLSNGKVNLKKVKKPMSQGEFVTKITNDRREEEMEQNLNEVSKMIEKMRNVACDMGNEIQTQNHLLDNIQEKTDSNREKIEDADQRAKDLLYD